jgi:hypothetical protein
MKNWHGGVLQVASVLDRALCGDARRYGRHRTGLVNKGIHRGALKPALAGLRIEREASGLKVRQIHVQVKRPGITARKRQGYFAPPE